MSAPARAGAGHGTGAGAGPEIIGRVLPWLLAAAGAVGLLASAALLVEKIRVLQDPGHIPSCSIDPVLSCGSVMETPQAEAFGLPNPILGVIGFSVVTTVGAALLSGARLPRWFHLGLWAGTLLGAVFVHWLIFQSLYRISALCPYCMVVWAVTVPIFWYTTLYVVRERYLPLPGAAARPFAFLARYHSTVLCLWALALTGAIAQAFWTYWTTPV